MVRRRGFDVWYEPSGELEGLLHSLLPDPDRLFAVGQAIQSPWQNPATDKAVVTLDHRRLFFKRYNCPGGIYSLKNIFRQSRALKSWKFGWKFLEFGLPTPRPVACLEERRLRLLGRSYLLFEMLDGARSLLDGWTNLCADERCVVLRRLGREIGRMHHCGLLHGDLNWRNILIRQVSSVLEIYFVDLDGCRWVGKVSRAAAAKDMDHFYRDLQRNQATERDTEHFSEAWELAFQSGSDC